MKSFNVLAAVSLENGLEYKALKEGSINSNDVLKMINAISKLGKDAILFTDCASYFTSGKTKRKANKLLRGGII